MMDTKCTCICCHVINRQALIDHDLIMVHAHTCKKQNSYAHKQTGSKLTTCLLMNVPIHILLITLGIPWDCCLPLILTLYADVCSMWQLSEAGGNWQLCSTP